MLDGAQKLDAVALLLERVVGGGGTLKHDLVRFKLKGLLCVRRKHEAAVRNECGADVLTGDLAVIAQLLTFENYLKAFEAGAVVKLDKAEILHVTDGAGPAADRYFLIAEALCVGIDVRYLSVFQCEHSCQ